MKVTTVRLPDDLAEAVAEAADDTERSQSEYIRHVLRTHFDSKPNTNEPDTDTAEPDRVTELEARLDDLEGRFAALETDAGGGGGHVDAWREVGGATERSGEDDSGGRDRDEEGGGEEVDTEAVREAVRVAVGDGPPRKTHAREALVDAVALLADRGALETGELKAELYPRYETEYSTKRTMWNSLDRHLGELPGVHKPEYGTWAVDVEALQEE